MNLLVHGVYDALTLKTLKDLGVYQFAFDLRSRSSNLVPLHHLKAILNDVQADHVHLIFENDKDATVHSFLNILKDHPFKFILEFRDQMPASYYDVLNHPFIWMFHPDSDWKAILQCRQLKGILLPLQWKEEYKALPLLWEIIESRKLEVFLHAASFEEATPYINGDVINFSIDLGTEVEQGFRSVDQERLRKFSFWRQLNEYTSRQ